MWLETVISPKLAWADGRSIESFEPFEVRALPLLPGFGVVG
jgi:hypothetical protein